MLFCILVFIYSCTVLFTAALISATKKGLTFAVTTACLCTLSLVPLRICSPFFLLFPESFPCQRRDPGSVTCDAPCDSHIARDEHRGHCLASRWQIVAFLPKARRMLVSSRHTESIFCADCFLCLELRTATSQLLQAASPSRCRWKLQGHLDSWIHHAADLCICKSCSRVSGTCCFTQVAAGVCSGHRDWDILGQHLRMRLLLLTKTMSSISAGSWETWEAKKKKSKCHLTLFMPTGGIV